MRFYTLSYGIQIVSGGSVLIAWSGLPIEPMPWIAVGI